MAMQSADIERLMLECQAEDAVDFIRIAEAALDQAGAFEHLSESHQRMARVTSNHVGEFACQVQRDLEIDHSLDVDGDRKVKEMEEQHDARQAL